MSWAVGYDHERDRDIGYGVPCICEHPKCRREIDRGLAFLCGDIHKDGGCKLYFCGNHLYSTSRGSRCKSCLQRRRKSYKAKPDVRAWLRHKLRHESWRQWRKENPAQVAAMKKIVNKPQLKGKRA